MTESEQSSESLPFREWLLAQMDNRGITGPGDLAKRLGRELGREVNRSIPGGWLTKPRGSHGMEVEHLIALAKVLRVPAESVVLAEAAARGIPIDPQSLLAAQIPAWTNRLPDGDIAAWLDILDRLGKAHGLTE